MWPPWRHRDTKEEWRHRVCIVLNATPSSWHCQAHGDGANHGTKVPLWAPTVGTSLGLVAGSPGEAGDKEGGVTPPYHDGIAGAGGQEDVLCPGGDAVAALDELGHVPPHQFDARAGAVGTCAERA